MPAAAARRPHCTHSSENCGSSASCHRTEGWTPQAFGQLNAQEPEDASQRVSGRQKLEWSWNVAEGIGSLSSGHSGWMLRPNRRTVLDSVIILDSNY